MAHSTEITESDALDEIMAQLRDRPYACAYKADGLWTVIVYNGQGDEQYSVSGHDEESFAKIKPICSTINIDDGGSEDNPDYDASLI